jgi:protein arginine kinase
MDHNSAKPGLSNPLKNPPAVKLEQLAQQCGEWLRGSGPESDIVISTRMRLARNLAEFPFIRRCTPEDRTSLVRLVRSRIPNVPLASNASFLELDQLSDLDRQFLMERQLISRELVDGEGSRGVVIDPEERFSIMVNEEDHLRVQVMRSGLDLDSTWETINSLDDQLESQLTFAFQEQLGYLTACPTNVGTGLRVSVMLHLPALVITKHIERVFRSLQKISVTVRGLFGEGSQFMGDFYQVSNQITLGRTEAELIGQVSDVVPMLIEYERRARDFLLGESHEDLLDEVSRALGILCTARKISSEETLHYLSKVRLGINLGLLAEVPMATINKLFIHTQPAHLQKLRGQKLSTSDRNIERASYLQQMLGPPRPHESN